MLKEKLKASLLHLLLSALVVGSFISFAMLVWYPEPFLEISGLEQIVLILVSVDLILGPILTFVIFKPHKPRLKFDLSVIVAVQAAALAYGIHTIYEGHPVYVAYAVDRFSLVVAKDAKPEKARYDEFKVSTLWKPQLVYAKQPADPKVQADLMFSVLAGGPDIDERPEYYEPFNKFAGDVLQHGLKPGKLFASPENRRKLEQFLAKYGKSADAYAFLPLSGQEGDVLWVWNRATAKPVASIDINPWKQG